MYVHIYDSSGQEAWHLSDGILPAGILRQCGKNGEAPHMYQALLGHENRT